MKDRIVLLIKAKNLTAAQFADEIGVQKSGISHIISGRNNASLDFIQKILLRYPEVRIDWLMFGKGPIFNSPENDLEPNIDKGLSYVHPTNTASVDLFSGLTPASDTNFRNLDELSADSHEPKNEALNENRNMKSEIVDNKIAEDSEQGVPGKTELRTLVQSSTTTKSIIKIVEFYSDNTFKEFFPE